jgi:ATP-dependent exoDNAse (exonuclease V) beta subunit
MVNLTHEQGSIVDRARRRESFKVQALAGTGKTFTMTQIAMALPIRPLFKMLKLSLEPQVAT